MIRTTQQRWRTEPGSWLRTRIPTRLASSGGNDSGDMAGRQRSYRGSLYRPTRRGAGLGTFGRCSASTFELRKCGGQWVASAVYAYRRLLAAQQFHRLEESRDGPPQRASVRGTKCPTDFALANMFTSAAAVLTFILSRI